MALRRSLYAAFLLIVITTRAWAADPFRYADGKQGKAELKYVNDLPVLIVSGTPEEIGEEIGTLAAKPASRLVQYPKEVLDGRSGIGMKFLWPRIVKKGEAMVERFPAEYRKELDAMARASGLDRDLLVAGNTMFDMKNDIGGALFGCS